MNSYSAIYCISAISQNNVRLSDIFQITTLILIMSIVFLHWTIRTQNRTAVHDKFSWFPVWCPCISLIQFQPEALANTVVQCKPFKHRSDWVTPRAGPQAEDHASTLLPLLCSPLCFQENEICIQALLWPWRFAVTPCAIWERAPLCSCSASTAHSQVN